MADTIEIPARGGKAARVARGQHVKVINTHGEQVVDTWAYNADDLSEYMSMQATRAYNLDLIPRVGQALVTNRRREILTVVEDTCGVHDTLMAACDNERYGLLGCTEYHDNCADNLRAGMTEIGAEVSDVPSPLNLFMNIPWTGPGKLSFEEPKSKPGDYILMRAEIDLIVAFSACPQDILPINGKAGKPVEAHFEVA